MSSSIERSTAESLYRRYGAQVRRCCQRILRDDDAALDASQEVFVTLLRKGGDFRGDAEWMTWLFQVSTRVCLNRLRAHTTHQRLLALHGDRVTPGGEFDPEMLHARGFLRTVFDTVETRTQEIVIYHHVFDMGHQEVADVVGVSRQTVINHLSKFRSKVQAYLQERAP